MPKIRIKKASTSYLERFANKSYSTDPNGVTTFTTSGMLNSNYKKALDNFYNSGGKYFKIEQLSKNGNLTDESDFFDDSSTIEFVESTKNNRILDVPVVKIANTDDYYITSDPALLSQNTITLAEAKHDHLKISDQLVSSPNFIDFDSFSENSVPSAKTLSKTKENVKEEDFRPFIDEDIFDNVSDSFLTESFVYEDEEYHLGNEQRIEIELDFSDKTDAYLLNTQLFYKSNNFFDALNSGEPDNRPDDVFVTDQVNFLADESDKTAITSHFMPNAIWNNTSRRWEYNLINEDFDLKVNPYLYNKSLFDSLTPDAYDFPNLVTQSHNFGTVPSQDRETKLNENIFSHLNYISSSPLAFTSFCDRDNTLSTESEYSYLFNTPTKTYGFPNSEVWKTSDDHNIQMSNYIPGDFLLEKVIFEGTLDIFSERPTKKGNFVNHHQDYTDHPNFSALTEHDAILFNNNTQFNQSHNLNEYNNEYISAGINFYLIRKSVESYMSTNDTAPNVSGYVFSRESKIEKYVDFELSSNDQSNPYVSLSLNDLKHVQDISSYEGEFLKIQYTDDKSLSYEPIKSSIYNFIRKDDFNNIETNRKTNKFYYLDEADLNNIDLITKNYFSILNSEIDHETKIYTSLSSNNITKEIKTSNLTVTAQQKNDLISHSSIAFLKAFNQNVSLDTEKLNASSVVISDPGSKITYKDYNFKISESVKQSVSRNKNLGENRFSITSNYVYNNGTNQINIEDTLSIIEERLLESNERDFFVKRSRSSSNSNIKVLAGKTISKNEPKFSYKNYGYLLKKSDNLVVGLNSFSGFNNLISYAQIKDKLKITLIGRELNRKQQNESFYSNSIKKSFSGNQTRNSLQKKGKEGKYFNRVFTNNKEYVSDSVLPDVSDVYLALLNKNIIEGETKDSLDWFLNLDSYNIHTQEPAKTNKLIFSNTEKSGEKYENIISDWHKVFYMSKYKNNDVVSKKQLKNNSALIKSEGLEGESYLYFDIDSYSVNYKYDVASGMFFNNTNSAIGTNFFNVNSNILCSISKFLIPNEYETSHFVSIPFPTGTTYERYFNHSGIPFLYDTANNTPYSLTKDSLTIESRGDNVLLIDISAAGSVLSPTSIQYMKVPTRISSVINENNITASINTNNYKEEWVLVLENPTEISGSGLYQKLEKFRSSKYRNKVTYYKNFYEDDISYEILYDKTFKLTSVFSKGNKEYKHNFYIIYKNEAGLEEKAFVIIPLPLVKKRLDSSLTINTGNSIYYNEFFDINFSKTPDSNLLDKDDFKVNNLYKTFPKTYSEMFLGGPEVVSFSGKYNFSRYDLIYGSEQRVTFYLPKYELEYTENSNLSHPFFNATSTNILDKNKVTKSIFNIRNNISRFNLLEKKNFAIDISYYDLLDNVLLEKNNKNLFLNKILSVGRIFKKSGNKFVKTNNRIIYEVSKLTEYRDGSSEHEETTYMSLIGLLNTSGKYDENDLKCLLMYDIKNTDIIRIYDEKILDYDKKFKLNFDVPYVEIDLSIQNPIFDDFEDISSLAIKYSHYATNNFEDIPEDASNLKTYGSPIAKIDDTEKVNNFLYSYSRNKKYSFPIDQTSGFRYGVHNPTPVNTSYYFNTNHYGQFKDRSYDTQNYSMVKYVNDRLVETHCVRKRYYDDTKTFIEESVAAQRDSFDGSNTDVYDRVYHPFIESNDGSDMSYLYT